MATKSISLETSRDTSMAYTWDLYFTEGVLNTCIVNAREKYGII